MAAEEKVKEENKIPQIFSGAPVETIEIIIQAYSKTSSAIP